MMGSGQLRCGVASTFFLYRILGNDLPPRHGSRQTLENLRFLLDHEPDFPDLEKRWVVNRIANKDREGELIALLEERGQAYVHIPFEPDVYGRYFLDSYHLPERFNPFEVLAGQATHDLSGLALEWLYRQKNRYVINVNGARNAAVEDGIKAGGQWIMPWDGACFLTEAGFNGILATVTSRPDVRYGTVPMVRLSDNRVLLKPDFRAPPATDEPQIVFHREARDRFDEELRYGHRPKAELFIRLGIPGPWQGWMGTPWEPPHEIKVYDKGRFASGGWVARLARRRPRPSRAAIPPAGSRLPRPDGALRGDRDKTDRSRPRERAPPLSCYGFLEGGPAPGEATLARLVALADGFLAMEPVSVLDRPPPVTGVDPTITSASAATSTWPSTARTSSRTGS